MKIEQEIGRLLRKQHLTTATAESCTGGLVGDRLTDVPGSSDYFIGGVVAYSNHTKMRQLGVAVQTLRRWGAVSEQTVREMAAGVCRRLGAEVGLAVSGVAGPGGGTKAKPVGLVWVCCRVKGRLEVERHLFVGTRRRIKQQAATAALRLCRRALEDSE